MIRFGLVCENKHAFEAWFRNSEDFESQKARDLVSCPHCNSHGVEKALMAPAIATREEKKPVALSMNEQQKQALAKLKEITEKVRHNADYVGDKFAEEARKIHFGETEARGIYGEATAEEAKSLADEGVEFMPLPVFPDDQN
ncbi:DUF1178 family protein [Chelativorans sp. YIM 93263]|uniref:DUF1178 family protein n=1 Tax=Chelativorans sp. YIM 93263 TaxID=2906648 RepID=UPI002379BCF6|nr:DUF1178 family protein [Chelativorans sp. YIM 93263]